MEKFYSEGSLIDIEATIPIPAGASREQVIKWIEFKLGFTGGIDCNNPLSEYDLDADRVLIK